MLFFLHKGDEIMYMKISESLIDQLKDYQKNGTIVLDLDDGVGKYSKFGTCAINISFRLLVLGKDQDQSDYTEEISSDIGEMPIKKHSEMYLEDNLILDYDPRMSLIKLKGPSGMIDGNVQIVDLREKISN